MTPYSAVICDLGIACQFHYLTISCLFGKVIANLKFHSVITTQLKLFLGTARVNGYMMMQNALYPNNMGILRKQLKNCFKNISVAIVMI